jgi:hypothetical protein
MCRDADIVSCQEARERGRFSTFFAVILAIAVVEAFEHTHAGSRRHRF